MQLTFHIIYTPGTVKALLPLLYSLIKWSDCYFRLVANGCDRTEQAMLQTFCAKHERLSYQALPTYKVMVHGDALNYLQSQNQSDYFAFLDSDIYATEQFMPTFLPQLAEYQLIASALPLRYPQTRLIMPQGQEFMAGPFTHTGIGRCLGTTFFAIYDNQVITNIRRSTGIGFIRYRWEEIPAHYQQQLQELGVQCQRYDTAKVLNLLLHLRGYQLRYQPCPQLRHIEAVSRFIVERQRPWLSQLRALLGRCYRKLTGQAIRLSYDEALPQVSQFLWALAHQPSAAVLPKRPQPDWVVQVCEELLAIHTEFMQTEFRQTEFRQVEG